MSKGGDNYEKKKRKTLLNHNSPYYRNFNYVNKNSTNCIVGTNTKNIWG